MTTGSATSTSTCWWAASCAGRTQRSGANDIDGGDTFDVNLRLGYRISPPDSPFAISFLSMDYQRAGGATDYTAGLAIPNSANREMTIGAGVLFQLKPGTLPFVKQKTYDRFSIQYSHGISGRNTGVTNGVSSCRPGTTGERAQRTQANLYRKIRRPS
ncbi:hypothetical protein [Cupriavidus necator]|uniref:hypothetical protein n=1 Tax=Cupriavidus necator TaxID=106590 RepID=UPI00068FF3C8|nr:hypothetical protein [Cupriavidus necator]